MSRSQIKLGLVMLPTGQHIAGWRHPGAVADMHVNFRHYAELAKMAERAKFHLVFLADGDSLQGGWSSAALSRTANRNFAQMEPLTLLSALAAVTERIGLVGTASTTYGQPYRVARQFGSLDIISGGRSGWNVVTSLSSNAAANFGMKSHPEHAARYERASEFVDVVKGLWGSWEDDAFPRDKASGIFFDPAKLHTLGHEGKHFSVRGPLNVPRSPQGHPVIVQAGSSGPGKELAARTAELVFTAQSDFAEAKQFYADLKSLLPRYGRAPADLKIMPGLTPIVAATEQEARDKFEQLQSLIDPVVGLAHLSGLMGVDLSGYDLDKPLPDIPETNAMKSRQDVLLHVAQREGYTLRQLCRHASASQGHLLLVGSGKQVADQIEAWFVEQAADGFNLGAPYTPGGLEDFIVHVLPELRKRGLFHDEYEGRTLRDNLA